MVFMSRDQIPNEPPKIVHVDIEKNCCNDHSFSCFFSIGMTTNCNGTLMNTVEWICFTFPVTTYGGQILSSIISTIHIHI